MAMTRLRQGARCVLRLPFVLLALLGLLLSVTATARWPSLQRRCLRWGSWTLCQAFSVRLPAPLALPASPQLIVVNHISWLDVVVLSALLPPALETRFLAKAEVGRWPVIGPFARGLGMAFIDRSSAFRSYRALPALAKGLQARSLLFFPEGTTTDGVGVAPLKPMGFELAARAGVPVQPLFLRYFDGAGRLSPAPAFLGDDTLLESVLRLARAPAVAVEVERLPALPAAPRKALARSVEEGLRAAAERRLAPRPPFR
ncbi:MAG: lysophospholipid acyltransferase family protein, partial [Pseudomonadales bacterium]